MDIYKEFRAQKVLHQVPAGPIVAAVSGGADSVCLLHCLKRLGPEKNWTPVIVHIQHHLRGKASLRDETFVEDLARKWGMAFESREIRPPKGTATEERSRMLRYVQLGEAAKKHGAKFVLTAHNANDQAETFFLNLLRGSGADGLCGMEESRSLSDLSLQKSHGEIQVVRPLLSLSRKEIEGYLASQKLSFREDSTNLSLKYRRNWVRHKVIPLLEVQQPRLVERIAELARILRGQKEYLNEQVGEMRKSVVRWDGEPAGECLDLTRFFRYNSFLRQYFLHRLHPRSSYREIGEIVAFLNKQKDADTIPLTRSRSQ